MRNKANFLALAIIGVVAAGSLIVVMLFGFPVPRTTQQSDLAVPALSGSDATQKSQSQADWSSYSDVGISFRYPEKLTKQDCGGYVAENGSKVDFFCFKKADGDTISIDRLDDPSAEAWMLGRAEAQTLLDDPRCETLHSLFLQGGSSFHLPKTMDVPNLCGARKADESALFYVIGVGQPFESLPSLDAMILVIRGGNVFLMRGAIVKDLNARVDDFVHPYFSGIALEDRYMSDAWLRAYDAAKAYVADILTHPDEKLKNDFRQMEKIADSIYFR